MIIVSGIKSTVNIENCFPIFFDKDRQSRNHFLPITGHNIHYKNENNWLLILNIYDKQKKL